MSNEHTETINPDMLEAAVNRGLDSYCRVELILSKGMPIDRYKYTVKMQKFTSRLEAIVQKISSMPDLIKFVFSNDDVEVALTKGEYKISAIIDVENLYCVHCIIQKGESIGGKYFEGENDQPVIDLINAAMSLAETKDDNQ